MWNTKLEVESESRDDNTRIYSLSGALFASDDAYAFQQQVRDEIAGGAHKIVIDLSSVEKIDSSGIGILVALMWSASRAGGALVLAAIPSRVEKILEIAKLLDHIDHAESEAAALAMLEGMKL
jgi:anti-sigma B factor antagonist